MTQPSSPVSALIALVLILGAPLVSAASDPSLTAVKLPPDSPLAALLDAALPVVDDPAAAPLFGSVVVKKAYLLDGPAGAGPSGHLITCSTAYLPSRAPHPLGHFDGCLVEEQAEADSGILTLSFKDLLLKLGGSAVLPVPGTPICHTRAC